jgi:hypothetical protein
MTPPSQTELTHRDRRQLQLYNGEPLRPATEDWEKKPPARSTDEFGAFGLKKSPNIHESEPELVMRKSVRNYSNLFGREISPSPS